MSDFIHEYFSADGLTAYASCRFCGRYVGKALSSNVNDIAAMTDAISQTKQHQISCEYNPDKEESEMEKWLERIKKK